MPSFRGHPACSCLVEWLPVYEAELKRLGVIKNSIDIFQLIGGAKASGGTHSTGGAFDIAQSGKAIDIARQMGADATWRRPYNWDRAGGIAHTHGVLRGCPHNGPARYQIAAVDAGYNGLGYMGRYAKDNGPRPLSKRTWQEGIKWAKARQTPPKPPKVYPEWFKLGEWNLSGFDVVFGKAQWDALEDKKVAEIAALDCDIWCLLEIPNPKLEQFSKKLARIGLKVVGGTDGRYIVAKNSVKVGRIKTVTLTEKGPANDDKQIVIAELWPEDGAPVIVECGHLEYREGARADKARVTQAKQVKQVTLEFAKLCKVPESRVFFANDENSEAMVSRDAFGADWPDVFDTATKSTSAMWRSLVGWSGKYVRGARIDKVHAHESRPIVAAKLNTSTARKKISDHIPTIVTVGSL